MKAHGPEDGHAHAQIGQRHHFPVVATVLGSALRASRVISLRVIDIACRRHRIPTMPFKRSPDVATSVSLCVILLHVIVWHFHRTSSLAQVIAPYHISSHLRTPSTASREPHSSHEANLASP